ncbi:hypothetical protein DAI22_06g188900 [Oryza sativa Japonica Group]|nr:hypothetical protein DAI22_06g188900 [Oryza sativa Japonica Group]
MDQGQIQSTLCWTWSVAVKRQQEQFPGSYIIRPYISSITKMGFAFAYPKIKYDRRFESGPRTN